LRIELVPPPYPRKSVEFAPLRRTSRHSGGDNDVEFVWQFKKLRPLSALCSTEGER